MIPRLFKGKSVCTFLCPRQTLLIDNRVFPPHSPSKYRTPGSSIGHPAFVPPPDFMGKKTEDQRESDFFKLT